MFCGARCDGPERAARRRAGRPTRSPTAAAEAARAASRSQRSHAHVPFTSPSTFAPSESSRVQPASVSASTKPGDRLTDLTKR